MVLINIHGCGAMSRRSKSFTGVKNGGFEIFVVVFVWRYCLPELSLIRLAIKSGLGPVHDFSGRYERLRQGRNGRH
jgi:hypothetical protein